MSSSLPIPTSPSPLKWFSIFLTNSNVQCHGLYVHPANETKLAVNTSRRKTLHINFDVTFPIVACSILSLDAMDINRKQHLDVKHDIVKKRVDAHGNFIEIRLDEIGILKIEKPLQRHGGKLKHNQTYHGSCYGSEEADDQCYNSCEDICDAYKNKEVFFFYDLPPIKVTFTEHDISFLQFLTNVCAIVGGVFTVTGIIDWCIYHDGVCVTIILVMDWGWMSSNYSTSKACATSNLNILDAADRIIRGSFGVEDIDMTQDEVREEIGMTLRLERNTRIVSYSTLMRACNNARIFDPTGSCIVTVITAKVVQQWVRKEFQRIEYLRTSTRHKKIASARHDFISFLTSENKLEAFLRLVLGIKADCVRDSDY
ncbi:hypothetical protein V6N11_032151 [Hibiscus sabdariffa]|uniref:Uncharacterized protein n=1 Tax=Hibiscus sabdariffa TaxID=183260 RepID=A0ABR2SZR5_9ROSI